MENGCQTRTSPSPFSWWTLIFKFNIILKSNRDSFKDCQGKNVWGGMKIQLLDTVFWSSLSVNPEKYKKKYRNRVKLLECDFAVMPMYQW